MRKCLVVIDMQNDFITGSLGTKEAQAIVPKVVEKVKRYDAERTNYSNIFFTQDTHRTDYLTTQEGRMLPVRHCITDTEGWKIHKDLQDYCGDITNIYMKETFGCDILARHLSFIVKEDDEIEVVGLVSDICVISNALLFKTFNPEVNIIVDSSCCAGTTPEMHEQAMNVMRSCQIIVK